MKSAPGKVKVINKWIENSFLGSKKVNVPSGLINIYLMLKTETRKIPFFLLILDPFHWFVRPTRIRHGLEKEKTFPQQTEKKENKKSLALIRECDMTTSPLRKYI